MRSSAAVRCGLALCLVGLSGHASAKPTDPTARPPGPTMFDPIWPGLDLEGYDIGRHRAVVDHVLRVVEPSSGAFCTGTVILLPTGVRALLTAGHCLFAGRTVVRQVDVLTATGRLRLQTDAGQIDEGFRDCVVSGGAAATCSARHADRAMVPLPADALPGVAGWPVCQPDTARPGQRVAIYAHGLTGETPTPLPTGVPGMGIFRVFGVSSVEARARSVRQALHHGDSGGPVVVEPDARSAPPYRPWVRWTVSGFTEGGAPRLGTTAMLHPMPGPISCSAIPPPPKPVNPLGDDGGLPLK